MTSTCAAPVPEILNRAINSPLCSVKSHDDAGDPGLLVAGPAPCTSAV